MIKITIKGENGKDIVLGGEGGNETDSIKELKLQLDTPNDNAKSRKEAIMAKVSFKGKMESSEGNDTHNRLISLFKWAQGYDGGDYRTVVIEIMKTVENEPVLVRSYEFPKMFICDYTENYSDDELTFEMKLNQREGNVAAVKTGI